MLVGIISDTHDNVPNIEKAVQLFRSRKVDLLIHAGDYCSPFTVPHFEGLPLRGVFGNNDGDKYLLMKKYEAIGASLEGEFFETETGNCRIAVYHGTYQGITDALIASGSYDVVISGHTHEAYSRKAGKTLAVNPGTAHGFAEKATVALLETESMEVEFIEL